MSKWLRKSFIIAIGAVMMATAWWAIREPAEPSYDGKPLSFWLEAYIPDVQTEPSRQMADTVMTAVGTNAIPTLLRLVQEKDSRLKLKWFVLLDWLDKQYAFKIHHLRAWKRNFEGAEAFRKLGAAANGAVPALIKIQERKVSLESQSAAICSLGAIGPPAKEAVPALVKWLAASPNNEVDILMALGEIHSDPGMVVPVMVGHLSDHEWFVRQVAAQGLGAFGANARPAVPALVELLKDEKDFVRRDAAKALKAIDPEAAAKAGVK